MRQGEPASDDLLVICGYCLARFATGHDLVAHWRNGQCPKHVSMDAHWKVKVDWLVKYRIPEIEVERRAAHPMTDQTREALRKYREEHAEEIRLRREAKRRIRAARLEVLRGVAGRVRRKR